MRIHLDNTRGKNYHVYFAATINDKKARDKFIKGPVELRTVLETMKLDTYNRKYGDRKQKNKKQRGFSSGSSSNGEQVAFTRPARKRKPFETIKIKLSTRNCHFCGKSNWTPEHSCPARKSQCKFARRPDISPGFVKVKP